MRWPRSVISSFAFRRYYYFVTTTYPHALATQRHFLLNLSSLILLCHYNLPSCVGHAASFPPLPFVVIFTLSLQPTLMRWLCSIIPSFALTCFKKRVVLSTNPRLGCRLACKFTQATLVRRSPWEVRKRCRAYN